MTDPTVLVEAVLDRLCGHYVFPDKARAAPPSLYLLVGGHTFSGGEEFANNLKVLRCATLVGETTRGGAHPTRPFVLSPTVEVTVPVARAVNPVTGTNWEGTGVNRTSPYRRHRAAVAVRPVVQRGMSDFARAAFSTASQPATDT